MGNTEHVTVTHYSEQRGAMEKISVPSVNIFSAEIKTPKVENSENNLRSFDNSDYKRQTNNPFLNMSAMTPPQSPPAQITSINSTNPFKSSPISSNVSSVSNTNDIPTYPSIIHPNSNPFADADISSNKMLENQSIDVITQDNNDLQKNQIYERNVSFLSIIVCCKLHAFFHLLFYVLLSLRIFEN